MGAEFRAFWFNPCCFNAGFFIAILFGCFAAGCDRAEPGAAAFRPGAGQ